MATAQGSSSRIVEDLDAIQRDMVFDRLVNAVEGRPSHDETVMRARAEDAMFRLLNEDCAPLAKEDIPLGQSVGTHPTHFSNVTICVLAITVVAALVWLAA